MIVKKKNEGDPISYRLTGTLLSLGDQALSLDLAEEQCGYDLRIDISEDEEGQLVRGTARRYVAEIEIPAKTYSISLRGFTDDLGIEQVQRSLDPLDTDSVVLTLWAKEA
jgi:hypothetical protein